MAATLLAAGLVPLLASTAASAQAAPAELPPSRACVPGAVPEDGMVDVAASNPHEPAIDCVVFWGIAQGTGPGTYSPAASVNRGQMASFITRLVERSGGDLTDSAPDAFYDDNGTTHELSTNRLAAAGIVAGTGAGAYSPGQPVTRGQMATFLVRAYQHRTGLALADGPDAFTDDDGSGHEQNINRAVAAGFARGLADGGYGPDRPVSRDQMGSFLSRVLDRVVADTTVIDPDARVLSAEQRQALTSVSEQGELRFSGPVSLAPGDVVVSEPAAAAPSGLLRRVTAVQSEGGQTVVSTEQAVLTDVVQEGSVAVNIPLRQQDLAGSAAAPPSPLQRQAAVSNCMVIEEGYEFEVGISVDVQASSCLELQLGLDIGLGFGGPEIDQFSVVVAHRNEMELSANYGFRGEWQYYEQNPFSPSPFRPRYFKPITFSIGPLPVVIIPTLFFGIDGSAELTAKLAYVGGQVSSGRFGAEYDKDDGWSPVVEGASVKIGSGAGIEAVEATAEASLRAKLEFSVYGVGGPYISTGPYVRYSAACPDGDWTVTAGVRKDIGIHFAIPVIGVDLADFSRTIAESETELFNGRLAFCARSMDWRGTFTYDHPRQFEVAGGSPVRVQAVFRIADEPPVYTDAYGGAGTEDYRASFTVRAQGSGTYDYVDPERGQCRATETVNHSSSHADGRATVGWDPSYTTRDGVVMEDRWETFFVDTDRVDVVRETVTSCADGVRRHESVHRLGFFTGNELPGGPDLREIRVSGQVYGATVTSDLVRTGG